MRRKALLLLPEPPYPPDAGNALRDVQQIDLLGRLGFDVTLVCARPRLPGRRPSGSDAPAGQSVRFLSAVPRDESENVLETILRKVSYLLPGNRKHPFGWWLRKYGAESGFTASVRELSPDVVVLRSMCLEYLPSIRAEFRGLAVVDCHDDDVHLAREMVTSVPLVRRPGPWCNYRGVRSSVAALLPVADEAWAVSDADAVRLRKFAGNCRVLTVPSGVDERQIAPTAEPGRDGICALVANFGYGPNFNGARWFVESVWHRVRSLVPDAECLLVGGGREDDVRALAAGALGVKATGRVPDLAPVYRDAGVLLAPLLEGGGTRLKVVEAWKHGKAVAGTPKGLEGLVETGDSFAVSDDPETLAIEIAALLRNREARRRAGEEGLRVVREKYGWDRIATHLVEASRIAGRQF